MHIYRSPRYEENILQKSCPVMPFCHSSVVSMVSKCASTPVPSFRLQHQHPRGSKHGRRHSTTQRSCGRPRRECTTTTTRPRRRRRSRSRTRPTRRRQTIITAWPVSAIRRLDDQPLNLATISRVDRRIDRRLRHSHNAPCRRIRDTGRDESCSSWRWVWDIEISAEAIAGDEAATAAGRLEVRSGVVLRGDERDVEFVVLGLQSIEVLEEVRRAVGVNVEEAEVGCFLRPFVDETARQNRHLRAVEDGDFVEVARGGFVAAVLREEDGNCRVAEPFHEDVVAGDGEARLSAAPGIGVETKEVGARHVFAAV